MPFTDSKAYAILSSTFANGYIGLCTNDPEAEDGVFDEFTGDYDSNGYERVPLGSLGTLAGYPRVLTNASEIHFFKAKTGWGTAVGFGIFSGKGPGGSPFYYAKLTSPVTISAESVALFEPEALKIGFAEEDTELTV